MHHLAADAGLYSGSVCVCVTWKGFWHFIEVFLIFYVTFPTFTLKFLGKTGGNSSRQHLSFLSSTAATSSFGGLPATPASTFFLPPQQALHLPVCRHLSSHAPT